MVVHTSGIKPASNTLKRLIFVHIKTTGSSGLPWNGIV